MLERQKTEPINQQYQVCVVPGVLYVCGKYNGNVLKLMNNHCTRTNCKLYKYQEHNGEYAIGRTKKVKPNEDLFFCYNMDTKVRRKNYPKISCLCLGFDSNGNAICKTDL